MTILKWGMGRKSEWGKLHIYSFTGIKNSAFVVVFVLEFELRVYSLSHSASSFVVEGFFEIGSH
jgi:hypothetical protein